MTQPICTFEFKVDEYDLPWEFRRFKPKRLETLMEQAFHYLFTLTHRIEVKNDGEEKTSLQIIKHETHYSALLTHKSYWERFEDLETLLIDFETFNAIIQAGRKSDDKCDVYRWLANPYAGTPFASVDQEMALISNQILFSNLSKKSQEAIHKQRLTTQMDRIEPWQPLGGQSLESMLWTIANDSPNLTFELFRSRLETPEAHHQRLTELAIRLNCYLLKEHHLFSNLIPVKDHQNLASLYPFATNPSSISQTILVQELGILVPQLISEFRWVSQTVTELNRFRDSINTCLNGSYTLKLDQESLALARFTHEGVAGISFSLETAADTDSNQVFPKRLGEFSVSLGLDAPSIPLLASFEAGNHEVIGQYVMDCLEEKPYTQSNLFNSSQLWIEEFAFTPDESLKPIY